MWYFSKNIALKNWKKKEEDNKKLKNQIGSSTKPKFSKIYIPSSPNKGKTK